MRAVVIAIIGLLTGVVSAQPAPHQHAGSGSETAKGSGSGSGSDAVQESSPDEPDALLPPPPPLPPAPKPTPAPTAPAPAPTGAHTMDEVIVPRSTLAFGINFFGDTSALVTSPATPHTSFQLGALALRILGDLSPSVDALTEFALETKESGQSTDVEQLAVRWRKGPGQLEVGRFHTELGFWNTAYHHGLWLQMPIERPHVVRFEDDNGLIPAHWVGAHYTLQGDVGADGKLALITGLGNGRGKILDDVRVVGDTNEAKAVLVKVRFKNPAVELGAGLLFDRIAPADATIRPALPGQEIDEYDGNVYGVVHAGGVIAIGEGYVFRHQAGTQTWMTYAGFGVLGYAVTEWFRPYAVLDVIHGADGDPFFHPDPMMSPTLDVTEVIAGARFETSTWSAVKLEFRVDRVPGTDTSFTGIANWSWGL